MNGIDKQTYIRAAMHHSGSSSDKLCSSVDSPDGLPLSSSRPDITQSCASVARDEDAAKQTRRDKVAALSSAKQTLISRLEPVEDLVEIQDTARMLGHDVVTYMSCRDGTTPPRTSNCHALTLRRTVDQLSERHEIPFASMARKLQIGEPGTSCQSIVSVANVIFVDGQYNWGRVVTLYAFSGWIAKYCVANNFGGNWVDEIGKTVGDYVADRLSDWIAKQGGWDDMDRFFPEQENMESKIWRGLFYTMLGLGALATTVAAVR